MSNLEDDIFGQTSVPSLSFRNAAVGTSYTGIISRPPEMAQSRDYTTREPLYWPDGNPKMAAVVRLRINGEEQALWAMKPSAMFSAIGEARNQLGRPLRQGDELTVTFTGTKPTGDPRKEDQKLYSVTAKPGGEDVFAAPAPSAPAAPAAPTQQAPRAPQQAPQNSAAPQQAPAPQAAPADGLAGFLGTLGAQADPGQLQAAIAAMDPETRAKLGLPSTDPAGNPPF